MLSLWAASALAQNTVVSNNNPATLSSAVAMGGTVTFSFSGTITLSNTIIVTNKVAIDGTGYAVTISGGSNVQTLVVYSNASLSLNNLTLTAGGQVSGQNNRANFGGAISNGGSLVITGCTFSNNSANASFAPGEVGRGGAIFNEASLVVSNSLFLQNNAQGHYGLIISPYPTGGEGSGGAIYNASTALIANCSFFSNTAAAGSGGDDYEQGANGGAAYGGAVCNVGSLGIFNSTFSQNVITGGSGGNGINLIDAGVQPYGGGNGGAGYGGAVCSVSGNLAIINSTFANNLAEGSGGGPGAYGAVPQGDGGNPNGANGGNGGDGIGGGVALLAGAMSITNVTCANNTTVGGTGGMGGVAYYPPFIGTNGANGAPGIGQGETIANSGGSFLVKNSILYCASNETNGFGSIFDAGNNINSDATALLTNSTSFNNTNPLLGTLGNYGGSTQTIPLLLGSPAINAADPLAFPSTDQRGYPRPYGPAPDIGAFEFSFPMLSGASDPGVFQFFLSADPSKKAVVQASSNLVDWSTIATNTIFTNMPTVIVDGTSSKSKYKFYRVVLQ